MKLTPEDLARIEDKKVANILRKIYTEKRIPTAREDAILNKAGVQASGQPVTTGYANTWDELADACNIDRRTLTNVREQYADYRLEYTAEGDLLIMPPTDPETGARNAIIIEELSRWSRADGRKETAWWIRFLDDKGVHGRGVNNPDIDYVDERALRLRRELFQLKKAEWEFEKAKELMMPVAEFQAALSAMVSAFLTTLNQTPGRCAQKIVAKARHALMVVLGDVLTEAQFAKVERGLDAAAIDYGDIQLVIETEIEHVRRTLAQCEFLESGADTPAAECPPSQPKPPPSSVPSSAPRSRRRPAKKSGGSSKG